VLVATVMMATLVVGPLFSRVRWGSTWQQSVADVSVKRRIRPIAHAANQPVLDLIEMDVVNVPRKSC